MRRPIGLALAVLFGALPPSRDVSEAYRLARDRDDVLIPTTMELKHWAPHVWAPGTELVIHVADDPDWAVRFDSPEDALPYVEEALAFWTAVAGADIRWRVGGLHEGEEQAPDGRHVVSVAREGTSYAVPWFTTNEQGLWEVVECDIVLDAGHVAIRDDRPDSDRDDRQGAALIHELGHCLGSDHPAISPTVLATLPWSKSSVWSEDPRMSYGVHRGEALLPDDRTAALLVRPLPGSLEATGSISGALTLDGAPAQYVVVDVLRADGQRVRPSASVFSNQRGEFLAEGLATGEYYIWIHPLKNASANPDLAQRAATAIDDLVALQPIVVRAGEVSGGHDFALRRGRNVQ